MRVDVLKDSECCGCTACESICPVKCISMKPDHLGFLFPYIDDSRCINCGLCRRVCSFNAEYSKLNCFEEPEVYGMRAMSEEQLLKSQSGGAFYILSEEILNRGGVVYGAGFADHFRVVHKRAFTKQDRDEFRFSKYVQSDLRGIFCKVKDDIKSGKQILFTGTPCQIAGLKSYIKYSNMADAGNLLTIDLVCHGVPSPKIWDDYLCFLEKKHKEAVEIVRFRDKTFGWASHIESFKFKNGTIIHAKTFRELFYKHYIVRKSCSNCPFTNLKRTGDITIGDFWGWFKFYSIYNDNKGILLILINTIKGKELFNSISNKIYFVKSNIDNCLQPQLLNPIKLPRDRAVFEQDYLKRGFTYVAKKYSDLGWRFYFNKFMYYPKAFIYSILKILKVK